ncbi:hypothetical protein [Streptomyces boncukensis]|uniref:Uncharacterized protein n=1 Tax=Streptomyces boncukensis TaxID=2711219 RepID=A0A6G4WQ85_9ACTN|nr:hypothetical protein [Streptomyces boncukensis]
MSSPCDPGHAPVGDVDAVLMVMDSRLKAVYDCDNKTEPDAEQEALTEQLLQSSRLDDMLNGACTLIYMFMRWLRMAYEDHDRDVIEYVVPSLVTTMYRMPKTFRPEVIPTMAGLVIAAGTGLSPGLWRKQYGYWTKDEMNPLEATVFLLAEHINRITEDRDFATRMITEALARADEG